MWDLNVFLTFHGWVGVGTIQNLAKGKTGQLSNLLPQAA